MISSTSIFRSKKIRMSITIILLTLIMVFPIYIQIVYVEAMTRSLPASPALWAESFAEKDDGVSCRGCHKEDARPLANYSVDHECQECHSADYPLGVTVNVADKGGRPNKPTEKKSAGMIYIPAGEFVMGNDKRHPDEGPSHKVYIEAYYIDKYEVTNARYKEFVDATGHEPPPNWKNGTYPSDKERHPIIFVNWFDATGYCQWAGKRLPVEAEWEKAARDTDGRNYSWGNDFDLNKANVSVASHLAGDSAPVGTFKEDKSPYGVYAMVENVHEWTSSPYKPYSDKDSDNPDYNRGSLQ